MDGNEGPPGQVLVARGDSSIRKPVFISLLALLGVSALSPRCPEAGVGGGARGGPSRTLPVPGAAGGSALLAASQRLGRVQFSF